MNRKNFIQQFFGPICDESFRFSFGPLYYSMYIFRHSKAILRISENNKISLALSLLLVFLKTIKPICNSFTISETSAEYHVTETPSRFSDTIKFYCSLKLLKACHEVFRTMTQFPYCPHARRSFSAIIIWSRALTSHTKCCVLEFCRREKSTSSKYCSKLNDTAEKNQQDMALCDQTLPDSW
jgi:hypothetical protein